MRSYFCPVLSVRRFCSVRRSLAAALVVVGATGAVSAQIQNDAIFRSANHQRNAPNAVTEPSAYDASFNFTTPHTEGAYDHRLVGGAFDGVINSLTVAETFPCPTEVPTRTADSHKALQFFDGTAPVMRDWNSFIAPDGYAPQVFVYLVPQGPEIQAMDSLGPDAASYTLNPIVFSSSSNYRGFLYFYGSQNTPTWDYGAGRVPTAFVLYQRVTSFLFRTGSGTAAAEPSAAGLALAPFVFAGAAYLRHRFRRKK